MKKNNQKNPRDFVPKELEFLVWPIMRSRCRGCRLSLKRNGQYQPGGCFLPVELHQYWCFCCKAGLRVMFFTLLPDVSTLLKCIEAAQLWSRAVQFCDAAHGFELCARQFGLPLCRFSLNVKQTGYLPTYCKVF